MECNDPSRRQYAQNQYAGQQQPQGSSSHPPGQYSAPGTVERFRQSSYVQQQQSPTNTVPSTCRAGSDAQVYGFAQGPAQYAAAASAPTQSMQYTADLQQSSDVPRQQDSSQCHQYGGANAMYGMGQPNQQTTPSPYDQVSRYSQRPSTATETLASQFGVAQTPQYYLAGQSIPTGATAPEMAAPHLPSQYHSAYTPAGPSSSQNFGSTMIDPSQHPYSSYSQQYAPTSNQSADQAFSNYQAQMRSIFSQVRGGALREVGSLLMEASLYLIGNAEALVQGLIRDDDNLHDERIRLWDEFNLAWLVTLQTQFDMAQESFRTGQPIREPHSIMSAHILEHLSRELVRLCDSVEKHGLVDYQMGVAEEEIMDLLLRCLAQLDPNNATTGEESSASATTRGR